MTRRLFWASLGVFALAYLFLPTSTLRTGIFSPWQAHFDHYLNLCFFALGLASVTLYFLGRSYDESPQPPRKMSPQPSRLKYFRIFFSLVIFFRVIVNLSGPLDRDEKNVAIRLPSSTLTQVMNPFHSARDFLPSINQPIAVTSSFLSTRLWGMSRWSLRLPALGFCALFLLTLARFAGSDLGAFPTVLLYLHLASNQLALWYMASSKGYMSVMAFALMTFALARKSWETKQLPLTLAVAALLTGASHTFGALFGFLLWLSWLVATQLGKREEKEDRSRRQMVVGGLFLLPLWMLLVLSHAVFLQNYGDLFHGQLPNVSHAFTTFFGMVQSFWLRGLVCLSLCLALVSFTKYRTERPLSATFATLTLVFFGVLLPLLETRVLKARYFLVFLIPCLIVLAELTERILEKKPRLIVQGTTLVLLVVIPLFSGPLLFHALTDEHLAFETIARLSAEKQRSDPFACWSFSGDPRQIQWTRSLYVTSPERSLCRHHFHLFFGSDVFDHPLAAQTPPHDYRVVYRDRAGRALYESKEPTFSVSSSK